MSVYGMNQRAKGSGLTMPGIVGEKVPGGAAVYMSAIDGLWYLADADVMEELPVVAITQEASAAGRVVQLVVVGLIGRSDWGWTRGDPIYVSGVPGALTQVAPSNIQAVAVALTSTVIYVNPGAACPSASCGLLAGSTAYVGFDDCLGGYTNYFLCDGAADDVQINAALAYVNAFGGGAVYLESGTFVLADSIVIPGNSLKIIGCGAGTEIDGDALVATEHAIIVSGVFHCHLEGFSIHTNGGGGLVTHCIFIEDGADSFHIVHVSITDSDDNGIHIEGTTIEDGHIHFCRINGVDGHGIYVNMDGGENITRLHVDDTTIIDVGNAGVFIDASGGNNTCQIEGNIIGNPAGIGIFLDDSFGTQVTGNTITSAGLSGIHVLGSDFMNIADNIVDTCERHGIFFDQVDNSLIDGNMCNNNDSGDTGIYHGIHTDGASTDNLIIGNQTATNHGHGIWVEGIRNTVDGNIVTENDLDGIRITSGDCLVNNNRVLDNSQDAAGTYHGILLMGSADRCIISGNHIDGFGDSQEDGIHLSSGATEVTITGNHCQDGMGSGIALEANNDDCSIMGNFLFENDDYGVEISAGTCDNNDVMNNTFVSNGIAPVLDSGTLTKFQTKQYYVARDDDNIGAVPGKSITNGQTAYVAVHAPQGMQQVMGFNIYVIPNATQAAANWDLETDYGAEGEAYNTHEEAEAAATYNVTQDQWFTIDAFAAGMFASMVEEDTGGISVTVGGVGHNVTVVMAELYYV